MSKYDIPFLNNLLTQKGIPEPPKSKPPKLPKSVDSKLPMPKISHSSSSVTVTNNPPAPPAEPKKEAAAVAAIKVEAATLETEVHVTVSKPKDSPVQTKKEEKGQKEAKEWYWDYDENCWKECDPDEEYEWEYIDDDDNNEEKNNSQDIQATVKLSDKSRSQQNLSEQSKDPRAPTDSATKKDRKSDLPKDEGKDCLNINSVSLFCPHRFRGEGESISGFH